MKTDDPSAFLHRDRRGSGNNFRRTGVLGSGMTVARDSPIVARACFFSEPVENQAAGWIARTCVVAQSIKEHRRNGCGVAVPFPGEGECEADDQGRVILTNAMTPAGKCSASYARTAQVGRR
ncbi:hypothetical protein [Neorhizobium galegae]|uniref:hypothetical protein n=1 Tax=Neorhizobium galegae TaxID=399 RepID=UPI001F2F9751|nr:hypothetical protein [Neorhizobium galegae]UIK04809.1 hypothetical protein LZK81_19430 [Neorhizobium galegae]